ncbi:MAG: RES domain-containing protein [Cyanobacteria bacterium SZAS-4]|nr:RES domain-containing protein [Cyanobacteria bacterium SZAS-4]
MTADEEQRICHNCVGDSFLKDLIKHLEFVTECDYCEATDQCITLADLSEHVKRGFREHYEATSSEPDGMQWAMLRDKEINYNWEREGEFVVDIIQDEAGVDDVVAIALQEILDDDNYDYDDPNESEFGPDIQYTRVQTNNSRWDGHWSRLQKELKTETRFFNQNASSLFRTVFANLSSMSTKAGQPVLRVSGPGTEMPNLYRARVFQSEDSLQEALESPARLLGSPSSKSATAGRMNAQGISVFYGSTSAAVSLAEVRPPVGSQVAIAKFTVQKRLTLLDLTALRFVQPDGSIFDPDYLKLIEQAVFLENFCTMITQPVMPDFQSSEYLITQATADYLATDTNLSLDGIVYPSIQTGDSGLNVVLFHKSSRATHPSNDQTFEVSLYSHDADGEYFDCQMSRCPPISSSPGHVHDLEDDFREQVLVLDEKSITIYKVNAVFFETEKHAVNTS